jgi:hypothetical protein
MKKLLFISLSLIYGIFVNAQNINYHTDDISGKRYINIIPQIVNDDTVTVILVYIVINNGAARINYELCTNQKGESKERKVLVFGMVMMTGVDYINWDGTNTGAIKWMINSGKLNVTLTN